MKQIITKVALETRKISANGMTQDITTLELVLRVVRDLAAAGNERAITYLAQLSERFGLQRDFGQVGWLILPQPPQTDEEQMEFERQLDENQRKYRGPYSPTPNNHK